MALDSRFVTGVELEELFRDKDTGEPLAFGTVEFFQDDNRVVPKLVYTLQNAANPPTPPNYGYVPLPNPITLSAVGTISDNNGNNVPIYYFPFEGTPALSDDSIQLYYVVIRNASGVIQFTREAWPNTTDADNPAGQKTSISNQISNPQFVDVSFLPTNPNVLVLTGAATTTIAIAPKWDLVVNHTATTNITVQRTAVAGISAYPGNPPFTLTITPGVNIASVVLRQRFNNNPDIFGRAAGGANGYISASILLAPASNLTISYQPSAQPAQLLLTANNVSGVYEEFNNTVQLAVANNPLTGETGYVDILLTLPIVGATTFSNVQIVGLSSNIQDVEYDEITANREKDQLFNYYNALLQYKPIQSYLIGWDFPLNPAQFLGSTVGPIASGANSSFYAWDQLIIFQSVNNGITVVRAPSGALQVQLMAASQFALVQYLPASIARELLNYPLASNASLLTGAANLGFTTSLWYTTDATLPGINVNNSLVATLNANGKPATLHGNWTQVPRGGLGDALFTATPSANFANYGFSGWELNNQAISNNVTFFAIVFGSTAIAMGTTIDINSISLVPGYIPTIPATKTESEVTADCSFFYQKSFAEGTIPAQGIGTGSGEALAAQTTGAVVAGLGPVVTFPVPMYDIPTVILYNPVSANAQIRNESINADYTLSSAFNISAKGFGTIGTSDAGSALANITGVHWTSDSRLGTP